MKNSKKLESVKNATFAVNIKPILGGLSNGGETMVYGPKGKTKDPD